MMTMMMTEIGVWVRPSTGSASLEGPGV